MVDHPSRNARVTRAKRELMQGQPVAQQTCADILHHPRAIMVDQPGAYQHTCRACGRSVAFTVPAIFRTFEVPMDGKLAPAKLGRPTTSPIGRYRHRTTSVPGNSAWRVRGRR